MHCNFFFINKNGFNTEPLPLRGYGVNFFAEGFNTEPLPLSSYGVNFFADMFQQMNERISVLGALIFCHKLTLC